MNQQKETHNLKLQRLRALLPCINGVAKHPRLNPKSWVDDETTRVNAILNLRVARVPEQEAFKNPIRNNARLGMMIKAKNVIELDECHRTGLVPELERNSVSLKIH